MTEKRDQILECACDLYLRGGIDGFSMRKLARSVGVTAPALYRHFGGRDDVLVQVLGEAHDELFRSLSRALSEPTAAERFAMAGELYMEFALEHPRYFRMIHSFVDFTRKGELPEEVQRRCAAVERFWHDRVTECVDAGILRPSSLDRITLTFWSHAYGLLSLYLRRVLDIPEDVFRDEYRRSFGRILRGMATEEAAETLFVREGELAQEATEA